MARNAAAAVAGAFDLGALACSAQLLGRRPRPARGERAPRERPRPVRPAGRNVPGRQAPAGRRRDRARVRPPAARRRRLPRSTATPRPRRAMSPPPRSPAATPPRWRPASRCRCTARSGTPPSTTSACWLTKVRALVARLGQPGLAPPSGPSPFARAVTRPPEPLGCRTVCRRAGSSGAIAGRGDASETAVGLTVERRDLRDAVRGLIAEHRCRRVGLAHGWATKSASPDSRSPSGTAVPAPGWPRPASSWRNWAGT